MNMPRFCVRCVTELEPGNPDRCCPSCQTAHNQKRHRRDNKQSYKNPIRGNPVCADEYWLIYTTGKTPVLGHF